MNNTAYISKEGYDKLKQELNDRKKKRVEIANEIDRARQQGDISENSAYKSAIESKEFNETQISELNKKLKNTKVVRKKASKFAGLGSKIKVKNLNTKANMEFILVGEEEADSANKAISVKSPLGSAIDGQSIGSEITVTSPLSDVKYRILAIK